MNRREFLSALLSVPFGWRALFRKEVKKEKEDCSSMSEQEWNDRMDCRSAFLGGGEIGKANNGSLLGAVRDVLDQCECEVKPEIHYGQCEGNDFLLMDDGIRVDGIDAETYRGLVMPPYPVGYSLGEVEIINLDEGKFTLSPFPMWVVYPDGRVVKCDDITVSDPIWYELTDAEWEFIS